MRNAAIRIPVEFLNKGLQFLFGVYLARTLGPGDFGNYNFVLAWAGMFTLIMDFGATTTLTQKIAQQPARLNSHLGTALLFKTFLTVASLLAASGYMLLFPHTQHVQSMWLAWIALGLASYVDTLYGVFRGKQMLGKESLVISIQRVVVIILSTLALFYGWRVNGVLVATVVGNALTVILTLETMRRCGFFAQPLRVVELTPFMKQAVPLGLAAVFSLLYFKADTLMLEYLTTPHDVGLYNAAYRITETLMFLPNLLVGILFPVLASIFATDRALFVSTVQNALKYVVLLLMPIGLALSVGAPWIIQVVYGVDYMASIPALRILAWNLPLSGANFVLVYSMISANKQRAYTVVTLSCAVWNILLNLWVIPRWGFLGSSFTTLATEGLLLVVMYAIARKVLASTLWRGWVLGMLVSTVGALWLGSLLSSAWWGMVIAVCVYLGGLVLTKVITSDDAQMLRQAINDTDGKVS
jgi:O-antigen/teichoic acid export membrane protein